MHWRYRTATMLLLLLLLVAIQSVFRPVKTAGLAGAETPVPEPEWTINSWFEGNAQASATAWFNRHFAFREEMVRSVNQLRYSVFGELHPQVEQGIGGYLFERGYRAATCGQDFIGENKIELKLDSVEALNHWLERNGKQLLVIVAPNKWRVLDQWAPKHCMAENTNYYTWMEQCGKRSISALFTTEYFDKLQTTALHPIYSKTGTHWSIYGASCVVDSALRSIDCSIPEKSIETGKPRNTDKDLADLLNIWFKPEDTLLGYPQYDWDIIEKEDKPRVLVVGDSYYWTWYYLGAHQQAFAEGSTFLYYNRTAFGADQHSGTQINNDDRQRLIQDADLVLVVCGEPSLARFGYGFLEDVWPVIHSVDVLSLNSATIGK